MTKIWCQWGDLNLPPSFDLISTPIDHLGDEELEEIEVYVPLYMGGLPALSPIVKMKKLKILQLLMAGYEDALAFKRAGIKLFNARGVHDFSTAELTLGLVISSLRGIDEFVRNKDQGIWGHKRNDSIFGKSVAIVGAGSVAAKIENFLEPFGVKPTCFARSTRGRGIRGISDLDDLISNFDIVILAVPLTTETKDLFDAKRISRMKPGALLVNVSRGPVVNTEALLNALTSGHIRAAIDVTDPEPLPSNHPLWRAPNLIISPHVGGDSAAFEPHGRKLVEEQCRRLEVGEPLLNEVTW